MDMEAEETPTKEKAPKSAPRKTREEKEQEVSTFLIKEQFAWLGKEYPPKEEDWFSTTSFPTQSMETAFRMFALDYISNELRIPRYRAAKAFEWWFLAYGFKSPESKQKQ
jgi:hypothetical protein